MRTSPQLLYGSPLILLGGRHLRLDEFDTYFQCIRDPHDMPTLPVILISWDARHPRLFFRFAYTHFVSFSVPACLVPWGRGRGIRIIRRSPVFGVFLRTTCCMLFWLVQGLLFVESVDMAGASPPVVYSPLNGLTTWMHPPFFLCFATPLLFVRSSSGWQPSGETEKRCILFGSR
ncbi:hypothetical protein M430DRAFT_171902 [Amorphotheca resinae ATCC 22711]|uniref:Uncharacterized protein n=1 Tax=Amorphotheca resinae ATCC 22711 TaxID=857342 RepID=A0A2T3AV29_AMORE|nr:hypothetical protein M430DRAFT_171902 [Amorphotheca resinae ATCC 22711]PSS12502.1 hypothetical protein M430DRAFT_171902 [Amorphotheca resinae ATCC 22711]